MPTRAPDSICGACGRCAARRTLWNCQERSCTHFPTRMHVYKLAPSCTHAHRDIRSHSSQAKQRPRSNHCQNPITLTQHTHNARTLHSPNLHLITLPLPAGAGAQEVHGCESSALQTRHRSVCAERRRVLHMIRVSAYGCACVICGLVLWRDSVGLCVSFQLHEHSCAHIHTYIHAHTRAHTRAHTQGFLHLYKSASDMAENRKIGGSSVDLRGFRVSGVAAVSASHWRLKT